MKLPEEKIVEVTCSGDMAEITVSVGQLFCHWWTRHGSVGVDKEFTIIDEAIVAIEDSDCEYLYPERMKPGWTGGDKERCKWVFKALKKGTTEIVFRDIFRFEVEDECTLKVRVE
jgi:hypothetical protein